MPEAYAKLVPVPPQPNYKYAVEGAGGCTPKVFSHLLNLKKSSRYVIVKLLFPFKEIAILTC